MFGVGQYYPPRAESHAKRIQRYRENRELFLGRDSVAVHDLLEGYNDNMNSYQQRLVYIAVNLAGLICKKSADFLFGETALYSAGRKDDSKEQLTLDMWIVNNDVNITNYESAVSNAYRGDSFYKVRWGQEHEGLLSPTLDPFRVIIESQNAQYVFPQPYPNDSTKIMAYHVAYPIEIAGTDRKEWLLKVESHYPNKVQYAEYRMKPIQTKVDGTPTEFHIYAQTEQVTEVETGVPFPLVVHVPNFSTDDSWEGIDDLTELRPLLSELNARLSQISEILSKHSDPAMIVPQGTLVEGEDGQPMFRVGVDKVFEVMTGELEPKYLTWNGQLEYAFRELEKVIELILMKAEIPAVALGIGDSGTSGSSGLAIKWRMNSLLAKINRKRQYYEKALKRVFTIAQLLENDRGGQSIQPFVPIIKFRDGLPNDEMEQATIMQIRTGAKPTISQIRAIMEMENVTEEQAQKILEEIEDEALVNTVNPIDSFQTEDNTEEEIEGEEETDEEE